MITVHHLENSRSLRILWLMEELGLDYDVKCYDRDKTTNLAPAEYKALHPLGKAPIVTDGDVALAETGAIVEHFLDRVPDTPLRPAIGTVERDPYLYWMHAAEGSVMALLVTQLLMNTMESRSPMLVRPIIKKVTGALKQSYLTPSLEGQFSFIESHLKQNAWFAGDRLTAADIMMSFPMEAAAARGGMDEATYPAANAYLKQMHALPGYVTAIEKGGALNILTG